MKHYPSTQRSLPIRLAIAVLTIAAAFLWGCEEPSGKAAREPQSFVILRGTFLESLLETSTGAFREAAPTERYVFEVQNFVRADVSVFEEGEVSNPALQPLWDSAGIRWGFRKKDNPERIFWAQKNQSYSTKEGEESYAIQVEDRHKARFIPQDLPAALLQESEGNLEIYGEINIEGIAIGGTLDLPPDFKSKILQVTEISGRVLDFDPIRAENDQNKVVPGASIYYIHKESGRIFQAFSDPNGQYRVSVRYYGNFYRVVLARGRKPLVEDYVLVHAADRPLISNEDLGLNLLTPPGISIADNVLYDITEYDDLADSVPLEATQTAEAPVQGNAVDIQNTAMIPGAFLLFYDKVGQRIFLVRTDHQGAFNVKLPTLSGGTVNGVSFAPSAFGYIPEQPFLVLGQGNIPRTLLRIVRFRPDPGAQISDRDIDKTQDRDKDGLPDSVDPNPDNWDTDGDGIPDGADVDVDGDGTPDNGTDTDGDGIHDVADVDVDGDGIPDNGTDADGDGISDEQDTINNTRDRDNDGLPDSVDPNPDNWDTDGDGIPDGADVDVDGDGTPDNGTDADGDGINDAADVDVNNDGVPDNGTDADGDGINDEYDTIDNTRDRDNDGLPDAIDPDPDNQDTDGDGIPDGADVDVDGDGAADNGKDTDGDGINDLADADADGDRVLDSGKSDANNNGIDDGYDTIDNTQDRDKDGLPDAIDPNSDNRDTDGDGIPDGADVDVDGDGTPDNGTDADGDGIHDAADVDVNGDGTNDNGTDADNDGINDEYDTIDNTQDRDKDGLPDAVDPNSDNRDTDGDGIPDGADVDVDGDGTPDNGTDADGDGIHDAADVDVNGDGTNDNGTDADNDGINDEYDTIDNTQDRDKDGLPDAVDPNSDNRDTDGDGIPDGADVDVDGDGTPDNGTDADGDGIHDAADVDVNGDGTNDNGTDADNDGINDEYDTIDNTQDRDKDGLPDAVDPNPDNWDTDGDGIPDGADVDVDGDGTPDNGTDADNDGIHDAADVDVNGDGTNDNGTDADNDGINDEHDTIDNTQDRDNDGLPDAIDPDPDNPDTDGDGIPDGVDADVNGDNVIDNGKDANGDGIRDGSLLKPDLSWDESVSTSVMDSNGGKFDFGGSPVSVRLKVNAVALSGGNFSYVWSLNDTVDSSKTGDDVTFALSSAGSNTIKVAVSNAAGSSELSRTYELNSNPNNVSITAPTANERIDIGSGAAFDLEASAQDSDSNQSLSYSWHIDSGAGFHSLGISSSGSPGASSSKAYTFTQAAGDYTLKVIVSDDDGGSAEATVPITLVGDGSSQSSNTRPVIEHISGTRAAPENNPIHRDGSASAEIQVRNRVSANTIEIASISWELDGVLQRGTTAYEPGTDEYEESLTLTGPSHTVTMQVRNKIGELAEWSRTYHLNEAPELDELETAANPGPYSIPDAHTITAQATDANGGTLTYTAAIAPGHDVASESADFRALGGSLPGTSGALVSLPLDFDIGLSAGEYTLRIRVSDAHGGAADTLRRNIALTGASSTVSATAPKIFWTAATTGFDSGDEADATLTEAATVFDATSGESVTVAVRVEDPRTPSKTTGFTYQWELNGSAFTPQSPGTGTAAQVSRTLTKAGLNTIALVVVNDDGEASAEALRKFYLNTIPSGLRITAPTSNQTIQLSGSKELTLSASATDSIDDALSYSWKIYGKQADGSWSSTGTEIGTQATLDYTFSQAAGDYQIRVSATDSHNAAAVMQSAGSDRVDVRLNAAPVVSFVSPSRSDSGQATVGVDVEFEVGVTDANLANPNLGTDFTYTWEYQSPAGTWSTLPSSVPTPHKMTLKTTDFTSTVSGSPYKVRVRVADADGATAVREYSLSMLANRAPTVEFTGATPGENARFQLANVNAQTPARSFFVTATDPEGDTLSYEWYEGSAKLSGAEQSSLLDRRFYSPVRGKSDTEIAAMAANERHKVLVRADVGDGQNTVSVTRTLRLNIAPAIASVTAAGDATYAVRGGSLVYTVSASDKERDTLSYQWHYRRSGATSWTDFTGSTTATFAPAANWPLGNYQIAVTVTDSEGGTANTKAGPKAVEVRANSAPTASFTGATPTENSRFQLADVNAQTPALGFFVTATDPEGDALSYKWYEGSTKINGAEQSSLLDRRFYSPVRGKSDTEIAAMAANERHNMLVRADVGDGQSTVSVTRTLRLNIAPAIASVTAAGDATYAVRGGSLVYTVSASDKERDTLSYQWHYRRSGATSWTDFTGSTTATFAPAAGWELGNYEIAVTVTDSEGGTASTKAGPLAVEVRANSAPTASFTGATPTENSRFQLANVNAQTPAQSFFVTATDPEGDALSYEWYEGSTKINGAEQSSLLDRRFYSPVRGKSDTEIAAMAANERHKVLVRADVGDGQNTVSVTRTLRLNIAPSIASVTAAGDATYTVRGGSLVYTVSASDKERDTLSYQWHYRRSGATSWTNFTGSTTATFAPAANWPLGNYQIAVTVTDSEGGTANTKAGPKAVEVRANSAPTLSFTGATPTENSRFQLANVNAQTPARSFFVTATDPEGDALSYKWYVDGAELSGAEQSSLLDRRFYSPVRGKSDTEIAAMAANERHNMLVRADVGDGQNTVSVTRTLRLNIAPSIASVTAEGNATSVKAGNTLVYTVSASDKERDTLSYQWHYRLSNEFSWRNFIGNTTTTFAPGANWPLGNYQIAVTVTDSEGGTANTKAGPKVVQVKHANRAPTVSFTGATPTENTRFQLANVNARTPAQSFFATAADEDGDALSYQWYTNNIEIPDRTTNSLVDVLLFSPMLLATSQAEIAAMSSDERHNLKVKVVVSDGQDSEALTRTLRMNIAPAISSVTASSNAARIKLGDSVSYTVSAADPEEDTLSYQWHQRRKGESTWKTATSTTATMAVNLQQGIDLPGTYQYAVTVTDSEGAAVNTKATPQELTVDATSLVVHTDPTAGAVRYIVEARDVASQVYPTTTQLPTSDPGVGSGAIYQASEVSVQSDGKIYLSVPGVDYGDGNLIFRAGTSYVFRVTAFNSLNQAMKRSEDIPGDF